MPERVTGIYCFRKTSDTREINGATEKVVFVQVPWDILPTQDVLYHYSRVKKRIIDGAEGLDGQIAELEDQLRKRGIELPSNPRALLFGNQWSLGLEGETPVGGYYLMCGSSLEQVSQEVSRKTKDNLLEDIPLLFRLDLEESNNQ